MQIQLFDARMLSPLVRFLDTQGTRSQPFLDRVRIPGELVESGGWITKKQAYDFAFDIVQRLRSPDAIFLAYADFDLSLLGPIMHAMSACQTVKEALEVGARLGSTAFEGNEYFLELDRDVSWFSYREPRVISEGQTFINDMTLAVYYHLIRATTGEEWRPEQLRTRGLLLARHRTTDLFRDCQASAHSDSTGLAFPLQFLSRRLCWTPSSGNSSAAHEWEFGPEGAEPTTEKLHRLLASQFHYRKLPTLEKLAEILEVSPRTLKRQLATTGTTYTRLLDRLRFNTACDMLSDPMLTIREIAHDLGYSGTNNFVRGFRRMTGQTPGEYRRQHIEESL